MDPTGGVSGLRRGVIRLARRLRVERPEGSLSGAKLSVLGHLARHGPMTPTAIAGAERVHAQSLTRLLAELVADDLVTRAPDPEDRRSSLIALTAGGRGALARDMAARDEWLARAMAGLTDAERHLLETAGELLDRLADAAEDRPGSLSR